ncbi:unnamed protein product [Adineta steineri]|uniref:Uncharacterized protein n=2 Tax=Adineta steineri TaxID=433720 RepID=A0A819I9I5_9BILA|nr:unnamed protein product [Adineta steineri]CAF3911160.1 unnamed protein product [Adineta steineri]
MEEFFNQINELRVTIQDLEHNDIHQFVNETEQIGEQLKSSQEFLIKEIQRLKQDLNINYTKINYADELRAIDEKTLKIFKTKFQDLTQILTNVKIKEINTWHLVQLLRVNTSRLWHIFETATGTTITQEIIYEDLQKLLNIVQMEKSEQTTTLSLLEKEHGDLLIKMNEIQLSLEQFRTKILQIIQNTTEMKLKIKNQQQTNDRLQEQSNKKLNQLFLNTKDIQTFLIDYKSVVNQIDYLLKLIFHTQTQIEIHHKTILIYQTKLEKYKQDLTLIIINRTNYENQILTLQKQIHQQNLHIKQFQRQQIQINQNRQQFYQCIHRFEKEKDDILLIQQQLLDKIKQTTIKNNLLEKEIFHSNHTIKTTQYSYRQLIKDHNKQQNINNNLNKTIETNEQRLLIIKDETNQLTKQIKQQNHVISSKENQIDLYTKELVNLEDCLSTTQEELMNQQSKVNESKTKVKVLTQKMHRLSTDEKPLIKDIVHYQKQLVQNEIYQNRLESNLKQNETKIIQYKTMISKLNVDTKQYDYILTQENLLLQNYYDKQEKSIASINKLTNNLKHTEYNYQNLKEIFDYTNKENQQLKQQYDKLTFVIQILGQKNAIINNQLQPLYKQLKYLSTQYLNKVKIIEQSKQDLNILHKHYIHLRTYNHQLHKSISFQSQQNSEYLNTQYISNQFPLNINTNLNHIHYWHTIKISSPDTYNNISKLFLIKTKLTQKFNELLNLKKMFHEKQTLYHYLNHIYIRRKKLTQKIHTS